MRGKKAQGGDYLAFLIFVIGLIFLFVLVVFIIPPGIGGKKHTIEVEMGDLSDNLFLYGFLRQNINDINMADLIALSYINNNYNNLKEETNKILQKIQKEVNFMIYINEKEVIKECKENVCKGKEEEFITNLPTSNKEIINFKLVLYEAE